MISINSVGNPQFSTISNNYIDAILDTVEYGHIPCTLSNSDLTEYTIHDNSSNSYIPITNQQLFLNCLNNTYGNINPFLLDVAHAKQTAYDAVSTACDAISSQIIPSQTKQLAYQNALFILATNGGNPPTSGPLMNSFNDLALSWGLTPTTFTTLCTQMQALSLTLGTLELNTQNQINSIQNGNQLLIVLNTFEGAITAIINNINVMVPIPISRPNFIKIKGVNIE